MIWHSVCIEASHTVGDALFDIDIGCILVASFCDEEFKGLEV